MTPLAVDVVSDVVCPWCYLGKRRLERALTLVPGVSIAVRWRPYQLDASVPPEGMDRKDYIVRKFGSLQAIEPAHRRLEEYGLAEGLEYRFDRITRAANTINAHRVIRWAGTGGREEAMVERLFAANFTEGRGIGDPTELARLAAEVGLDADAVASHLATDEDRAAVLAEIENAYRVGVTGVPCFILAGRYAVMGAQAAETIADAIRQVATEQAEPAPAK